MRWDLSGLDNWTQWSPRTELAPLFFVDAAQGRHGSALKIESPHLASFGEWRHQIDGIKGGRTYRFEVWYRTDRVEHAQHSVSARLHWIDSNGNRLRPPDYALDSGLQEVAASGKWSRIEHSTPAPENATSVVLQLGLRWAEHGCVWFDDIS